MYFTIKERKPTDCFPRFDWCLFPPKRTTAVFSIYLSFYHQNNPERLLDEVSKMKTQLRNFVTTSTPAMTGINS